MNLANCFVSSSQSLTERSMQMEKSLGEYMNVSRRVPSDEKVNSRSFTKMDET